MFSTDSLVFLVLFIVPGAIYIVFNRYVRLVPRLEKDESIRLSSALIFSSCVLAVNFLILQNDFEYFVGNASIFEDTALLFRIITANLLISLVLCIVWAGAIKKYIYTRFVNFLNKTLKRPQESENEELWNDIFETKKYLNIVENNVVSIEKDGVKTVGMIKAYTAAVTGRIEFLVAHSSDIEKYFEHDKSAKEEDRIFPTVEYVYLDITNGLKISFYDTSKYEEWVNRCEAEAES